MAKYLPEYRQRLEALSGQDTLSVQPLIEYQELSYRISVLETSNMIIKSAPDTLDSMDAISAHFQIVQGYIQMLPHNHKFGPGFTDQNAFAQFQTAQSALKQIISDCTKRFSSLRLDSPDAYKRNVITLLNTIMPVWLQYRNTLLKL